MILSIFHLNLILTIKKTSLNMQMSQLETKYWIMCHFIFIHGLIILMDGMQAL